MQLNDQIKPYRDEIVVGMPLHIWSHESCTAQVGTGGDWATVYFISSEEEGKGHAQALLLKMKEYYEALGLVFGATVALNPAMKHIYKKLNIKEYD